MKFRIPIIWAIYPRRIIHGVSRNADVSTLSYSVCDLRIRIAVWWRVINAAKPCGIPSRNRLIYTLPSAYLVME